MQIYLARPGGPSQGPYTVAQINADLAARKYRDDDYWAWHYGLPKWVPLYSVGGISGAADTPFFFCGLATGTSEARTKPPEPPASDTAVFLSKPPWLDVLQQAAEVTAFRFPAEPEVDTVVLLEPTPAPKESQPPREAQTEVIAASEAPAPAVEEPAQARNAATEGSGDRFTPADSTAPNSKAPEAEAPVPLEPQAASQGSQPLGEAQTAGVAVCVAPTAATDEAPIELSAPSLVMLELATPVEPPTPATTEPTEPIVVRAVKGKSSKRRSVGRRRLFLLEGQATRQTGSLRGPTKMPRRAFASRKRRKPLPRKAPELQPAWN